jgi:hypothetical protein
LHLKSDAFIMQINAGGLNTVYNPTERNYVYRGFFPETQSMCCRPFFPSSRNRLVRVAFRPGRLIWGEDGRAFLFSAGPDIALRFL